MNKRIQKINSALALLVALPCFGALAATDSSSPGILGKNDWLFYRYEITEASDAPFTEVSIDLISRLNREFARNGVTMAMTMVPIKMRIYAEFLPPDIKPKDDMLNNYARMGKLLQNAGVNFIDMNTAFMNSPMRLSDTPLYMRLDTHWAPSGALLGAEAIKAGIDSIPELKKVVDRIPAQEFKLTWDKRKVNSRGRDLIAQLPKGTPSPAPEQLLIFRVTKAGAADNLLAENTGPGITLVGSSYSHAWTSFPEALRFTLQRDLLSISVGADQGSWVGMESYLRNDAFQSQRPEMVIWEMPERDMRAPPNYKYREARYVVDNTDWLLRSAAWIQKNCAPSASKASIEATGLAAQGEVKAAATTPADFVELSFDKPVGTLDYLSANLVSNGSKKISVEVMDTSGAASKFTVATSGEDTPHILRIAIPATGKTYNKLRITPGNTDGFSLKDVQVCRLPEDLLK